MVSYISVTVTCETVKLPAVKSEFHNYYVFEAEA